MSKKITVGIIDLKINNIFSVYRGCVRAGFKTEIINFKRKKLIYDIVILPGVGAFKSGIRFLKQDRINEKIKEYLERENSFIYGIQNLSVHTLSPMCAVTQRIQPQTQSNSQDELRSTRLTTATAGFVLCVARTWRTIWGCNCVPLLMQVFLTALTLPGQLVATAFSFVGVCFPSRVSGFRS